MIVAFLDLLGFSALVRQNIETALDTMNAFNDTIKTRVIDQKTHPLSEYQKKSPYNPSLHQLVRNSSVTSFEQMISFSDSLVLGGSDADLFITQLSNYVASVFIQYAEPFRANFTQIEDVKSEAVTNLGNGDFYYHTAFPIMFRGGISFGDNVGFFNEYHIKESELKCSSLNVLGLTYLNAVKLEAFGKGPRLFCDKSVVDALSNKKTIKLVDKEFEIYEVIWTIEGCEAICSSSDCWTNTQKAITTSLLPASINLYNYYRDNAPETVSIQYKCLLDLVCTGIVKYAKDSCGKENAAIDYINHQLFNANLPTITQDILVGFLE